MIFRELRMLPTLLRVGFAGVSAYRAEVIIWILTTTMPLIMYSLWAAIAEDAPIGRFDASMFASYFLVTLVVRQLSSAWVVWELNDQIRTGTLSMALLRPIHPLWLLATGNLAALPFRILVLIPVVGLALLWLPTVHLSAVHADLWFFLQSTALAWVLTFQIQSLVGLFALLTQQSLAIQEAWFGLWAIFSGYLVPLELVPALKAVAIWLPFRSQGFLATEIALGQLQGDERTLALAIQLGWVCLAWAALRFFWPRAMRRFEAYGN